MKLFLKSICHRHNGKNIFNLMYHFVHRVTADILNSTVYPSLHGGSAFKKVAYLGACV